MVTKLAIITQVIKGQLFETVYRSEHEQSPYEDFTW